MPLVTRARRTACLAGATALAATLLLAQPVQAASGHVVINEVYGGGGNSGAPYTHDFVELLNPGPTTVDLAGYTLSYYSASGNLGNTCTLSGSVPAGGHFLVQQAKGAGGAAPLPTPDALCTASMSATAGSVQLAGPDGAVVDLVGFGGATKVEGTSAPAASNTTSVTRTNGRDTDDNAADFVAGPPTPQNAGSSGTPSGGPSSTPTPTSGPTTTTPTSGPTSTTTPTGGPTATTSPTGPTTPPTSATVTIAQIQGAGAVTPLLGTTVTTTGVVTASYPTGGFNGFYLQTPGSGGRTKTAADASDGVFVYTGSAPTVKIGDCYDVTGTAAEYNGLTQLTQPKLVARSGCAAVTPTPLTAVPVTDADKEAYEGMLVLPQGDYTISNNYQLNQYGQLGLAAGTDPLWQATDRVVPAEAAAFEAEQLKRAITLDDGSSWDYLRNPAAQQSPLPYLSQATPMRTGSQVRFTAGVILDYRFQWNYQPTGQVVGAKADFLSSENTRPSAAPAVGGDTRIASMNVLNYFTDLGQDEPGCKAYKDMTGTPVGSDGCLVRGAYTPAALADQQAKIVSALATLDADVVGLMEVENSARFNHDRDAALRTLTAALNARAGAEVYAYVPSPAVLPVSEDVIRTALIYKKERVTPVGPSIIQDSPSFANARQPLGQRFQRTGGQSFVVLVNHFKSKGSGDDDGTGQGLSNPSREAQARDLTAWVSTVFGDEAAFLVGDFNAYSKETPAQIIEAAGYTDLVRRFNPRSTSYQYSGRLGSLDHAYTNAKGLAMVTGADDLDINGDESVAMQYSRRRYNTVDFYEPTMDASSDHDPVVVGMKAVKVPVTPVVSSYQSCTAFGFTATPYEPGDQLRIDGTWNGQAQLTTVPLTDAGWYSGSKPTWTQATAVVVRGGQALEQTRVSITQKPECRPTVKARTSLWSVSFAESSIQPGDQLRVTGFWHGRERQVTVPSTQAGWATGFDPTWGTVSAVVVRDGVVLEDSRATVTNWWWGLR